MAWAWVIGLQNHELDHGNNTQEWRGNKEYLAQILHMTDAT